MKLRLFLVIILFISSLSLKAQFGYNKQIESIDGIEIKYKIENSNNKTSLLFLLNNTNNYKVNVKLQVEYSIGMADIYNSELIEVKINANSKIAGSSNGLKVELPTDDAEIFETDDAEWEFSVFEVSKIEKTKKQKTVKDI